MTIDLSRRATLATGLAAGAAIPFSAGARAQSTPLGAGKLYVTSWFGAAISVVDLAKGETVKTIPVGVHDHNVYLSPE